MLTDTGHGLFQTLLMGRDKRQRIIPKKLGIGVSLFKIIAARGETMYHCQDVPEVDDCSEARPGDSGAALPQNFRCRF